MVSWSRKPEEQATVASIDPNISPSNKITNVAVVDTSESTSKADVHAPKSSEQGATLVFTEVELAKATAERLGEGYDGTVIENVATVSSSDLCGSILVYVDKIVQLGDILSQVVTPDAFPVDVFTYRLIRSIHMPSWHGKR
jgi:hypothetical protein